MKIKKILNKNIKEYDIKLLITLSFVFIFLVGVISYKISSSYALFTDEVNGSKTLAIHYENVIPKTTLFTDGTLIINEKPSNRASNIQAHGAVSHEYPAMKSEGTDVEKYIFTRSSQQPWVNENTSVTSVEIGQKIYPISTSYWFFGLKNMTTGDFTNLDTSNVTDMSWMFHNAGSNSSITSFSLIGLDNWDTSKVTDMRRVFSSAGSNATTFNIGDLSGWDMSSVIFASDMFHGAGSNATTFNIGDLSNWNVSKVTTMVAMFSNAGYSATTWSIGDLSNWDTSQVTNMSLMFDGAGSNATIFNIGNLSNWNVSKVTDMSDMFRSTGLNSATWSVGDLSTWDVSNVKYMSGMFEESGVTANVWSIGDLSNWDTSKVTGMKDMFASAGRDATTWNSIGTLNVYATNIHQMFYECANAKAIINIYSNPTSSSYGFAFYKAATDSNALITVNYSSATTYIDNIIDTKSSNSNVVKGSVIS